MFEHHLALALGKTIHELRTEMPTTEYRRWVAFAEHYPIDHQRLMDLRFASVMHNAAMFSAMQLKTAPRFDDFRMPWDRASENRKPITGEAIISLHRQMAGILEARAGKKKKPKQK